MRCLSFSAIAALAFLTSACSGSSQRATTGTTAAASGSGTTTSGATASAGTSGSGSTGASSSAGSSGGGACGANAVWTGPYCLLDICTASTADQACLLVDGGKGTCIGTTCNSIDTLTDSSNCGGYGLTCPTSTSCVSGKCSGTSGTVTCQSGDCPVGQSCDGVNTSACGTDDCANASPGQRCEAPSGLGVCCGTTCSDLDSDSANCGGCGRACAAGGACQNGRCLADCTTASNNALCVSANSLGFCCNGACETVTNDTANCGACGMACPTTVACANGRCTYGCDQTANSCPTGFSCGSASGTCAATSCGGLADGTTCGLTLANGQTAAGVCCAAACLNARADDHNCGGCGVACGGGAQCVSGTCQPAVNCATAADNQACPLSNGVIGACCGGACVDLDTDTSACGQCGKACGAGDSCTGATELTSVLCQAPGGGSGGACSGPGAMAACPPGTRCDPVYLDYCETTDCSGQPDRVPCEFPDGGGGVNAQCCAGQCNAVDDASNCGGCGRVCPAGATCSFSKCSVSCADGGVCPAATFCSQIFGEAFCLSSDCSSKSNGMPCGFQPNNAGTCCNGTCTNEDDSANCGGCGLACPSGSLCLFGNCVASSPATTCATACGDHQVCSPTGCVDGLCSASGSACAAEDGTVGLCCSDGACVDLLSDPTNCGACGLTCGPEVACQQGLCLGGVCNADRHGAYCGTSASQICCGASCADVGSDSENCGACGKACAAGTTCTNGVCQ